MSPAYYRAGGSPVHQRLLPEGSGPGGRPLPGAVPALLSGHPGGGGCERSRPPPAAPWMWRLHLRGGCQGQRFTPVPACVKPGRTGGQGGSSFMSGQRSVHVRQCAHATLSAGAMQTLHAAGWQPCSCGAVTPAALMTLMEPHGCFCKL